MKLHHTWIPMLTAIVCILSLSAFAQSLQWKPVDPAHLSQSAPTIEKDADAEALFWEVHVKDEYDGDLRTVFYNYIRLKVFTERGVEKHGKVDILYFGRGNVRDIAGRTIKPDGTIVELKKDAVFDREIIRISGVKVKPLVQGARRRLCRTHGQASLPAAGLRTLVLKASTIPVEQYSTVRGFFERIRAVEQAPVVLAKP
jgi:hypothetical protein